MPSAWAADETQTLLVVWSQKTLKAGDGHLAYVHAVLREGY